MQSKPSLKVAFYAPLKPPGHARPSGDRRIAQLFIEALRLAHCEVELASELRAWEGQGEARRQADIEARGQAEAARLIAEYQQRRPADRPQCWFTYHLYHKAPDWIGPLVSAALDIPYAVAEASVATSQSNGQWARGYAQSLAALRRACLIFNLNSNDLPGVLPFARHAHAVIKLKPFTDLPAPASMPKAAGGKQRRRRDIARRQRIDADPYWLLCVAMMRDDSKRESYRILADAMAAMQRSDWQLLVVGDGPAEAAVADMFSLHPPGRIHFLGRREQDFVYQMMRASDLFVWPAKNEAFGMAALEALGCGLPVLAGHSGGLSDIVENQVTGVLLRQADGRAMADEIEKLLAAPARLQRMSTASLAAFNRCHRIKDAAATIGAALAAAINPHGAA